MSGYDEPGELERILRWYYYGGGYSREDALAALRALDPAERRYKPAEYWLDGERDPPQAPHV